MSVTTPNPYLRTKVMTASPAELRLMLLDGAIKFLRQGKAGLESQDYEASYTGLSRCQNILMELINALQPEQSPDVCDKLAGLYTFMYTRLINASTERDPAIAQEVLDLLEYERETWVLVMDQLGGPDPATDDAAQAEAGTGVSVTG
ncbi:MAG: flagellar export chaperone FliS [Planctomycetes bacterium]|nr:flagellar export chaperone FliS [Planctomycetota bacterium]